MPDDREPLGRIVRKVWTDWAKEQPDPKPSWLAGWEDLDDGQREVDMRIASVIAVLARAEVRGRIAAVLKDHYLAGITCDHGQKLDNPVCGCSRVFLGWHPSIGEAVGAWIGHVMDVAGSEEENRG